MPRIALSDCEWTLLYKMSNGMAPKNTVVTDTPWSRRPLGCTKKCRMHKDWDIAWNAEQMKDTKWGLPWPWCGKVKEIGKNRRSITVVLENGITIKLVHVDVPANIDVGDIVNPTDTLGITTKKLDPGSNGVHLHMRIEIPVYPYKDVSAPLSQLCFLNGLSTSLQEQWNRAMDSLVNDPLQPPQPIQQRSSESLNSVPIEPIQQMNLEMNLAGSSDGYKSSSSCCALPCLPDPPVPLPAHRQDPIILNLDGNGIETLGLDQGICFDHDCNGFRELTGWVAPGNAFLVLDANANDVPDNGGELFGDLAVLPNGMTALNGFQALAYYDTNGDGRIDPNDPIWSKLRLWEYVPSGLETVDTLLDGQMTTLDEVGISQKGVKSALGSGGAW